MTEFDLKFRIGPREIRCKWCLDWIMMAMNEDVKQCPYCGSDLSTKHPRYDWMMDSVQNKSQSRKLDEWLRHLRQHQFNLKHNTYPSNVRDMMLSPLVGGFIRRMHFARPGMAWSGGYTLAVLFNYIHNNPDAPDIEDRKQLFRKMGEDLYRRGGVKAMRTEFAHLVDYLSMRHMPDFDTYRFLWNDICDEWKY